MAGAIGLQAARQRSQARLRAAVCTVLGIFFAVPLLAMLWFTAWGSHGGIDLSTWRTLFDIPQINADYPELATGVLASLGLVVLTIAIMLALLVPTMTWVRLRVPAVRRLMEFVCLLPLTIPAIVLVVGLAPIYAWVTYFLNESTVWLCFAYVILVLPYSYRALDAGLSAIDVRTLSEAARPLGASWFTVMWRVVLPNIRTAVLSASFLSIALVLGEFTVASLLSRNNLQTAIYFIGKRNAQVSVATSFAFLAIVFLLLFALSFAGSRRGRHGAGRTPGLADPAPSSTAKALQESR